MTANEWLRVRRLEDLFPEHREVLRTAREKLHGGAWLLQLGPYGPGKSLVVASDNLVT